MHKIITISKTSYFLPIILTLFTLLIYSLTSKGEGSHLNYFVLLADAFLSGRLYLTQSFPWLNELIFLNNVYYVVYPPLPAVLLMPFVFIFGTDFYQPFLSIFLGSLSVGISYIVLLKIFTSRKIAVLSSLLLAFGTMQWYHAQVGSVWYSAHIVASFFIWLLILESLTKKRFFVIGILIGLAYFSRLPAILSVVFVLVFLSQDFYTVNKRRLKINFRNLSKLFSGVLIFVLFNFLYNYLRFGVIYDVSYALLPVFDEPWYKQGLFNISYIPGHLKEIFFSLPKFQTEFPYMIPSLNVLALWFVTPAFFLIPFANFKLKIISASLIAVIIMSIPGLAHGSNGFSQFGFRFAIDYLPFLLILTASGIKKHLSIAVFLILLSILINLWGVIMISFLKIWIL